MPKCPQCSKPLRELVRRCPSCQADLDLLVDFVSHLQGGLQRAENLTRAGELGEAVWAYLEVLETEPDNVPARKQIGRVVTAVRQFDLASPARRMASGLPSLDHTSQWTRLPWSGIALALGGFVAGMLVAMLLLRPPAPPPDPSSDPPPAKQEDRLGR